MLYSNRVCIALILVSAVLSEEHTDHGPRAPHENIDGTHNTAYDHEAVLGVCVCVCVCVCQCMCMCVCVCLCVCVKETLSIGMRVTSIFSLLLVCTRVIPFLMTAGL